MRLTANMGYPVSEEAPTSVQKWGLFFGGIRRRGANYYRH